MEKKLHCNNLLSKNIEADGNKYSYKNWGDIQSITGF